MALKDNLLLLDMDEIHRKERTEAIDPELLNFCKKYSLTLDYATSDNVIYIQDSFKHSICLG